MPLQSSSTLLQVSVVGEPAATLHCVPMPSVRHTSVLVRAQAPTPAVQVPPSVGNDSSREPSQSSSALLQSSICGSTSPEQVP